MRKVNKRKNKNLKKYIRKNIKNLINEEEYSYYYDLKTSHELLKSSIQQRDEEQKEWKNNVLSRLYILESIQMGLRNKKGNLQ